MQNRGWIACALTAGLAAFACEDAQQARDNQIREEIQDLQEARQNTGQVVTELQADLDQAKQQVKELEKKLELAKQGITDEVLQERGELKEAVKGEEKEVQEQIQHAEQEAQEHNQAVQKATRHLEETRPPKVETKVESETEVTQPKQGGIRSETTSERIEVQEVEGLDQEGQEQGQEAEPEPPRPAPQE